MNEYITIFATLLGAIVGGAIGFASAYLIQRQRFKREDQEKLFENVYGTLYPLLMKARMRHESNDFKPQWPGEFWLTPPEVVKVEGLFAKYLHLIPKSIQKLWRARRKGPSIEGAGEAEANNLLLLFDLEKMLQEIGNDIKKISKQA